MATVAKQGEGYVINKVVYLGEDDGQWAASIVLKMKKWEAMRYGEAAQFVIDFPGEYEHDGVVIRSREAGDQLHYVLRFSDGETVAVLLNPKSLENATLKTASVYLCMDQDTKERVEQNEFEWGVELLSGEDQESEAAE